MLAQIKIFVCAYIGQKGNNMRVAVISDIHGNYQALESVIMDIAKEKCDKIWCLGDLAMAGPQPRMVLSYIMEHGSDWTIIQGNTDKLIADFSLDIYNKLQQKMPVMANALLDDNDIIEQDKKDFLKSLPTRKEMMVGGVSVLLVHGSPRRMNEDILPNMKLSQVQEMIEGEIAELILCGHTHVPCGYQTLTRQTIVNVGSVGRPMTGVPKACYVIVDFIGGTFVVTHKEISYDYETAAELMRVREFDGCNEIADQLLIPLIRHL